MTQTEEIGGFPRPALRSEVDGVPVYSSAADGPGHGFELNANVRRRTTSGSTPEPTQDLL